MYLLLSKPPSFVIVLCPLNYMEPFPEIRKLISGCHITPIRARKEWGRGG